CSVATAKVRSQQLSQGPPPATPSALARPDSVARSTVTPFVLLGSEADDEQRLEQLRGASTTGWMIRSSMSISPPLSRLDARKIDTPLCPVRWRVVPPSG